MILIDFELALGMDFKLSSHNYPNYYPPNAYVLWTFQYMDGEASADVVYFIRYGYVRLGSYDFFRIGHGWNGSSTSELIFEQRGYFYGLLNYVVIPAGDIFIEFSANSYSEGQGFQFDFQVENASGIHYLKETKTFGKKFL